LVEIVYFCVIRLYCDQCSLGLFKEAASLSGALLGYSLGMMGIVATVVALFYGLSHDRAGYRNFCNKGYSDVYSWIWTAAIVFLAMTAFTSILSFSRVTIPHVGNFLRVSIYFFMVSFLQSIVAIWVGIMVLKNSNNAV